MRSPRWSAAIAAFLFAAGSVGALAVPLKALSAQETRPANQPPQVVTSGRGEVRVPPDRATVTIAVQTRAATAAAAAAENNRKQRAVIDAIRAKGVPPELIGTSGFFVTPETQADRTGQNAPRTLSYLVVNSVVVEVRKLDAVGSVIDAALGAGANQIQGLDFGLSNADSARRAALAEAVSRARADADVVARAAGGSLGSLLELTVSDEDPGIRMRREYMAASAYAPGVPVEPGLEQVRAHVTVRWQFVSGPPR